MSPRNVPQIQLLSLDYATMTFYGSRMRIPLARIPFTARDFVSASSLGAVAFTMMVACSSDSSQSPDTQLTGDCALPIPTPADGTKIIQIKGFAFAPQNVVVKRGATVRWVNCETTTTESHTTSADNGSWDSPAIRQRETFSRTFNEPSGSSLDYHCVPHPFMKGNVSVE